MLNLKRKSIEETLLVDNLADLLTEEELGRIATDLNSQIMLDEDSRTKWLSDNEMWIKLALQVMENKDWPWQNASNIKYPLLTTSSMQFHARSQQTLMKGETPVKCKIVGYDPTGEKARRADRISKFMSFFVKHWSPSWEEEMDRLLMVLPILGTAFKKVYFSRELGQVKSEVILPSELIFNYEAVDFERCLRTHRMIMYHNTVREHQLSNFYRDVKLHEDKEGSDETAPSTRIIDECHAWLDLDEDGYKEPYIVTIDKLTQKVLRISPRFNGGSIEWTINNKISRVKADEMFIRYIFLPSLDSKLYGLGLGTLVGPINAGANSLLNQIIDAGTLSNLQVGFLARGARLPKGGPSRFSPGEWKYIHTTGNDIRQSVFPLPIKEPSQTLFNLLGMLVQGGQQVGAVADVMLGENPGQNQPYSTTAAVLEQGLKVFVGIYKRIYRALGKEYNKIYDEMRINGAPLYSEVLDHERASQTDFSRSDLNIVPVADPDMVSEAQKLLKAESLLQKAAAGLPLNIEEVTRRILEAEEHENIDELIQMPEPQPDPELVFNATKHKDEMQYKWAELGMRENAEKFAGLKDMAQAAVNMAKARSISEASALDEAKSFVDTYMRRREIDVKAVAAERGSAERNSGKA